VLILNAKASIGWSIIRQQCIHGTVLRDGLSRGHHPCACMCTQHARDASTGERGIRTGRPGSRSAGRARTSQAARVTDGHIAFRGSISPRFRGCNSRKVVSGPCSAGAARRMCASVYTASLHRAPSILPLPSTPAFPSVRRRLLSPVYFLFP